MGAWKGIHHGILLSSSEELPMAQEKIESLPALDHGAPNVIVETWKGQRSKFEFDLSEGTIAATRMATTVGFMTRPLFFF